MAIKEERKIFLQTQDGNFQKTSFSYQKVNTGDVFVDGCATAEDIDKDGDKDIIVGSLKYPYLSKKQKVINRIYINLGKGIFKEIYLPMTSGEANFILPIYKGDSSFSDLLVVNQINLQHYSKSTEVFLLQNLDGKIFSVKDVKQYSSLHNSHYVTGGESSDIDGDGHEDILLVSEWGIPKIYLAKENYSITHTLEGLESAFGLWQSVSTVDIDQDSTNEFILGNWGLNNKYGATEKTPLHLFNVDLDENGKKDILVSYAFSDHYYPFHTKMTLEDELPYLKKEFLSYRKMARKTTKEIFKEKLHESEKLSAGFLQNILYINKKGANNIIHLPSALQLSPLKKVIVFNKDKDKTTLLVNGNLVGVTPYEGRYDAMGMLQISYSLKEKKFQNLMYIVHPLLNGKELTNIFPVQTTKGKKIVVMTHEGELLVLSNNN